MTGTVIAALRLMNNNATADNDETMATMENRRPDYHFVVRWMKSGQGVEPSRVRPTRQRPETTTWKWNVEVEFTT
jgi:hypothetical protein